MCARKKYPVLPPNIGKVARLKNISERYEAWTIIDEIREAQNDEKIIVLQLLEFQDRRELRLAYYIIGKKPRVKGKWVWGQFCTMMPESTFRNIIKSAVEKGWV